MPSSNPSQVTDGYLDPRICISRSVKWETPKATYAMAETPQVPPTLAIANVNGSAEYRRGSRRLTDLGLTRLGYVPRPRIAHRSFRFGIKSVCIWKTEAAECEQFL